MPKGASLSETARKYEVPRSTLKDKVEGKVADKAPGPSPQLSVDLESELVAWILHCFYKGFPVTKQQVANSVKLICDEKNIKTSFIDNLPGKKWFSSFMKKHPELRQRVPENVSMPRAKVTETTIRDWLEEVNQFLSEEDLTEITADRLFNTDETPLALNRNHRKYLQERVVKTFLTSSTIMKKKI